MGAFTREKGQDIAIAAARLLPDVQFILAGEGPLLEELRRDALRDALYDMPAPQENNEEHATRIRISDSDD